MLRYFLLLAWCAACAAYRWSLPGDPLWPSASDYESLKAAVGGEVYVLGDLGYYTKVYNMQTNNPQPAVMVYPSTAADIATALAFANTHNMRVGIVGSGVHPDVRHVIDNGVVISLLGMDKGLAVDVARQTAVVPPGLSFKKLAAYVSQSTNGTLHLPQDTIEDSTFYGWAAAGGYGWTSRVAGLGSDLIVSFDVVLPNGSLVLNVSSTTHAELFRSLRGAGGPAFGIVTSLTVRLVRLPATFYHVTSLYLDTHGASVSYAQFVSKDLPAALSLSLRYSRQSAATVALCFEDGRTNCQQLLEDFKAAMPACQQSCAVVQGNMYPTGFNGIDYPVPYYGGSVFYGWSLAVTGGEVAEVVRRIHTQTELMVEGHFGCDVNLMLGGKASVPQGDSIAHGLRSSTVVVRCHVRPFIAASLGTHHITAMNTFLETLLPHAASMYWNEPPHAPSLKDKAALYWGNSSTALAEYKKTIDSTGRLTCFDCVGWDEGPSVDPVVCPAACSCSNNPNGICAVYDRTY